MRGRSFTSALLKQLVPIDGPARAAGPLAAAAEVTVPPPGPLPEPRDEAVFLLTVAAEIEHALMVQYLFAGYSVRIAGDAADRLTKIQSLQFPGDRDGLGQFAAEENSH